MGLRETPAITVCLIGTVTPERIFRDYFSQLKSATATAIRVLAKMIQ